MLTLRPKENLNENEKLAWLCLSRTENVGPITFYKLVEAYGSASKAVEALPEIAKRGGRKKPLKAPSGRDIEKELKALEKLKGQIITAICPEYPLALSAIDDAPPVLSAIGDISLMQQSCIAIVGARNASLNGRKFSERIARELGQQSQIIVSGLARGIDTAAHQGALESGTVAVVAGGIDVVYPPENQKLYEEICARGLVIAESALGQKPFAQSFPRRNRIVSGLSKAAIVIEANMRSGSLITARLAGEQGRDVMAVPGHPLDPRAAGPNHLIRQGATLVRGANDVLENLNSFSGQSFHEPPANPPSIVPPANDQEIPENISEIILDHLSFEAVGIDELIRACDITVSSMQMALLELELAGRVKRLPGGRISRIE